MPLTTSKTLLLVEDEAIIAMSEKLALEKYGYAVLTAGTGERAIEVARSHPEIDLVLMDINLGAGLDGTQVAEAMLRERDLPIIFLSSHSEREVVEKTEKISSYGYVVKNSLITVLDASIKMAFKLFDEKEKSKDLNNRLNATLQAIPDLMFVVDKDGYFESYHNAPSTIDLALATDRIIGSNLRDIFPPEEVERQLALYRVCLETGRVQTYQYSLVIDGKLEYFSLQLARLDANHVLSTIHDITLQEEALAREQALAERFAFACEAGGIGIWEYDLATDALVWDRQAYSLYGTTPERFPSAGDAWLALVHPEDRVRSEEKLRQALDGSQAYDDELRVIWHDGSVHTLRSIARLRTAADGTAKSFIGINLDMTRLRTEEVALQESMAMFTTLFKTIPYPVMIIDAEEKRYIDANDAALQSFGYSHDEMLGRNAAELGAATEQDRVAVDRLIRSFGYFRDIEMGFVTKDGRRRIGLVSGQLVRTKARSYVIQTVADITEQKMVEDRLRHSTAALDLILNSSAEAIYGLDLAYRCTFINRSGLRQLGYQSAEALIGKDMHALIHHTHEDGRPFPVETCRIYAALRGGESLHTEDEVFWRADGTCFPAEYWAYPQVEDGKLTGFVVTFLDISDRKHAERIIQDLLAEKELMLREVHHRIKNNMNTISSLLAIQADSLPDPMARDALEDAERRVQSMALLYDKLYRGSAVTELSAAEYLGPLIDGIIANFPNADAVRVEQRLDDFVLNAKQLQPLGIIINELLTNAMKHAFPGKRHGTIDIAAAEAGGLVRLTVHDDGIGLPAQIDAEAPAGFGLQLVRGLAEQLHGAIRLERNAGTTVVLEFARMDRITGQA